MSVICEAFGCLPGDALGQDWHLVRDVLDYRLLQAAKEQHNRNAAEMSEGQIALWREMVEATETNG